MILSDKSVKRFAKLNSSFIAYANDRLHVTESRPGRSGKPSMNEAFDIAREIWSDEEGASLVADYVRDNPHGLSRTDLKEISQWEHGIEGTFYVMRDGRDILFFVDHFAIAVRGYMAEIDDILEDGTPTFASTILLPFENVITYCLVIEEYPMDPDEDAPFELEALKEDSRMIRSARDFIRYSDEIKVAVRDAEEMFFGETDDEEALDTDHAADDEISGQHRGALAGLRGCERVRAKNANDDHVLAEVSGALFEAYLEQSPSDRVGLPLRDRSAASGKDKGDTSSVGRRRRNQKARSNVASTTEQALRILRNKPPRVCQFVRELTEAGGRIELTAENVAERGFLAGEVPPVFTYYSTGTTLIAYMPQDYVSCLSDVDWEAETELSRRLEIARHFFETVANLRGVDVFLEAIGEYETTIDDADRITDPGILGPMLADSEAEGIADFATCLVNRTPYLVSTHLKDHDTGKVDRQSIRKIVRLQADKPKRPLTPSMLESELLSDWMEGIDEIQELLAYLDEHVPDSQPDLDFADELAFGALEEAQIPSRTSDHTPLLEEFDFCRSKAQVERFEKLLAKAEDSQPSWGNRGWSNNELQRMIESGEWVPTKKRQ